MYYYERNVIVIILLYNYNYTIPVVVRPIVLGYIWAIICVRHRVAITHYDIVARGDDIKDVSSRGV